MNNYRRRFDNAFLTVIMMLGIISVVVALLYNFEIFVFPLIVITTVMIVLLGILVDGEISKNDKPAER